MSMGQTGVSHTWTAAEDALLGKMPDHEAARRIGVTTLSIFKRRKKLGIPAAKPVFAPVEVASEKRIAKMKADEYAEATNRMRAELGGPNRKRQKLVKRSTPRFRRQPLPVPLADLLDGKRIKDLSAEQFLAVARTIERLKRFGSQSEPDDTK